jgi:hypothetical protein
LRAFGLTGTLLDVTERVLVTLQDRSRANLGKLAEHDRYLVHREPDGTLIWEPAEVLSATETRLLADESLKQVVAANREDPSRLRRRDRSGSPRG